MFNGSRLSEGIFYDFDLPLPIDHCEIKADVGEHPFGFVREEFRRYRDEPVHLFAAKPCGCSCETGAFIDLDKDNLRAVTKNQIDFTALPAPPGRRDNMIASLVITRDDVFGGKAIVILNRSFYSSSPRPSAI